ncbi:MAG TPA: hypothetical protein VG225_08645 [Terracidiphilus sp.]|jgi:hypothetical protein|nr:hypothetical protein [Terracidiphilus sp.]
MRSIGNAIATLLVVSLAPLAYGRAPARNAGPASPGLMNGVAPAAQQDEAKPPKDEAKPPKQDQEKPPKQAPEAKPPKTEKQEMPSRQQQKADRDQKRDKDQAKPEQRRDKQQAGQHGRVPDDQFKAHFGQTHKFSVRSVVTTTRVVPNQTRFVYSGYTFVFVDPWPADWAFDDDCYIDYVDGEYFVIDVVHPGARVALMIVG